MNESVNVPAVKTCTHCHRELPIEKFSKNANARDGYDYICKDCSRAYKAELEERMKAGAPIVIRSSSKINKVINFLEDRFTKSKFIETAEDVGLTTKSAYTYFNQYLRMGLITHVDGAFYKKNNGALANRYLKQTPAVSPTFNSTLSEKDINEIFPPEKNSAKEAKPAEPVEHVKVLYKEKPLKDYDAVQLMAALYKYHGYREGWDKLVQVKIIKTSASQVAVMEQASKLPE